MNSVIQARKLNSSVMTSVIYKLLLSLRTMVLFRNQVTQRQFSETWRTFCRDSADQDVSDLN